MNSKWTKAKNDDLTLAELGGIFKPVFVALSQITELISYDAAKGATHISTWHRPFCDTANIQINILGTPKNKKRSWRDVFELKWNLASYKRYRYKV